MKRKPDSTAAEVSAQTGPLIEHLFRHQAGHMHARLLQRFGPRHLDQIEDIVQEALLRAMRTWPHRGIPEKPAAWLHTVARHLMLDHLKHASVRTRRQAEYAREMAPEPAVDASFRGEVDDARLSLIFACCHPQLPRPAQVALTLKIACGFSVGEIAHAFGQQPATVAQRLVRAKRRFRTEVDQVQLPPPEQLPSRLDAVLEVVYLLFNEGYASSSATTLIRDELCAEALRLVRQLRQLPATAGPRTNALAALICLHASRLPTRLDPAGISLRLAEQDRRQWDRDLISEGFHYLEAAEQTEQLSSFHLEAAIAACHATAPDFQHTDWQRIRQFYDLLIQSRPSPEIALSRAIAIGHADGANAGLRALDQLAAGTEQDFRFHAARAELLEQLSRPAEALTAWQQAASRAQRPANQRHIRGRIQVLESGD